MDNCTLTTKKLLSLLKVEHTNKFLKDAILSHPDHPSLLAIADSLDKYQMDHIVVKLNEERFDELPTPCIVQVMNRGASLFYTIEKIGKDFVQFYDDKNKKGRIAKEDFIKKWTGVCLMAEKTAQTKEPGIKKALAKKTITISLTAVLGSLMLYWLGLNILENDSNQIDAIIYSLLKIVGLTVGFLLLRFEVDQYNPTLQSFCSGGKKINCNSVLKSKYAYLLNGQMSLSSLGFAYFFGSLTYLVLSGFSASSLALIGYASLATIPIIAVSIIYQALIIKQWCKFCILIQAVLIAEVGLVLLGGAWKGPINYKSVPILLALLILPVLVWYLIKPLLEQQKESLTYKRGLKKIKNNPAVLEGLLLKSEKMKTDPRGLGISFKNPNAKYKIVKVCNPYCGPCAKAHKPLEDLVQKGIINLQILFATSTDENDYSAKPVRHFLAIDAHNKENIQHALEDWYMAEKKDYKLFAKEYPLNGELKEQDSKINAMSDWCKTQNITYTPTLFINGNVLPKEYSIKDLNEVLV